MQPTPPRTTRRASTAHCVLSPAWSASTACSPATDRGSGDLPRSLCSGKPCAACAFGGHRVQSTAQVQAIACLANQHRIPLWPISRGRTSATAVRRRCWPAAWCWDLTRMNRILLNQQARLLRARARVGFFDLHEHDRQADPAVDGDPRERLGQRDRQRPGRGSSGSPYGEHAHCVCGMEVVLPSGELVRTGMMAVTPTVRPARRRRWLRAGLGSDVHAVRFCIVTRAGFWLMPEPDATRPCAVACRSRTTSAG